MKTKLISTGLGTLLLFLSIQVQASLSGTYTIDNGSAASSTNYRTFASAVSDMISGTRADGGSANGSGISGAVVFNVANNTYNEVLLFTAISGASATKTITFQSAGGDSSKVILTNNSSNSATNNYTVSFSGASFVTFKKITISRTGGNTYGTVIDINGGSHYNAFRNCCIFGVSTNGTGQQQSVIMNTSGNDSNIIFNQNLIKFGSFGFYWWGSSTASPERNGQITNNQIDSVNYMGMYTYYTDNLLISGNSITNLRATNSYGIYTFYNYSGVTTKNKVYMPNLGSQGITIYYGNGTSTRRSLCANNMVSVGGTSANYGMYIYYTSYLDLVYNSILNTSTNANAYGLYHYSYNSYQTDNIVNNNVANTGTGAAAYIQYYDVNSMDYNNWYAKGQFLNNWNGAYYPTLAGWKTASGKDANAKNANPFFTSNKDLHTWSPLINGGGTPFTGLSDDIDGQARNATTPDIGADEFTPPTTDAGVASIDDPSGNYCAGSKNVLVTITNYGTATLTSAKINWKVNASTQTQYSWTGSLASGSSVQASIGSFSFSASTIYVIKAWTTAPNGTTDGNNSNDTSSSSPLSQGLSGTFTIGGTTPDYATWNLAVADLVKYGVCGPTIFNVRDGSYNEQVSIPQIQGTSSTNTITFQSQSGDSSKVTLYQVSGSSVNYVLQLTGADWCTFKKVSIIRTGNAANYYSRLIDVYGQSSNNTFTNCRLLGLKTQYYYYPHEIFYSNTDNDTNNKITNNYIKNGSYAFYWFGLNNNYQERGTVISGNLVDSTQGNGNYFYYQDGMTIANNMFNVTQNSYSSSTAYGLNLYYCYNLVKITKNIITVTGAVNGNNGLLIQYSTNLASGPALIANNMISLSGNTSNTTYGIYDYQSPYHNYYFNSVFIPDAVYNAYGVYSYTTSGVTNIQNNIAYNRGGGIALFVYLNAIGTLNNNDWITTGSTLASNNGTLYSTLAAWQTATSKEGNSVSANPGFTSWNNLHASSPLVNAVASPISGISDDIDGQTRNASTPDMGADEFTPPSNDAGVNSIDYPTGNYCVGTQNVKVTITNYGAATLTNVKINWTVNGTTQTQYSWTGSLAPGFNTQATIGSFAFAANTVYSFKAWTSSPNGGVDGSALNDTATANILKQGLSGTYTIGGTTPDYATYSLAVADLASKGVCGPVTFNVRSGSYNEQFSIPQIYGTSSTNTVTFQSQANDSTAVTLWYASGSGNNYVVQFNGADWVTFKKQTIQRTGASSPGVVLEFRGYANNNRILNNRLIGSSSLTTTTSNAIVYSNTDNDSANWFKNNAMKYGAYGFYYFGVSSGSYEKSTIIENNSIDSVYYMGFQLYYHDNLLVRNNILKNTTYANNSFGIYAYYCVNSAFNSNNMFNFGGANSYGIYSNYCSALKIVRNRIIIANASYGIYYYYNQSVAGNRGLVANNMVSVGGPLANTIYGLYDYYSSNTDYYHNNFLVTNTNTGSQAFHYDYHAGSTENIVNNIAINTGGGMALYLYNYNGTAKAVDNNDWYTTGTIMGWYNGTNYANLTAWRTASTRDSNSVSLNPNYVSTTDLHVSHPALNGTAKKLALITDDYDGQTRNATTPDIGADEFTPPSNDAGISAINSPNGQYCAGKQNITVTITNYGLSNLTSATINWMMNGVTQSTYSWTGNLTSGTSASATIGTYTFVTGNVYSMKSWTTNPNGSADGNSANDTSWANNMKEGMAGTYTIGGTTPDYATFTLAAADLALRGVCGAVVFNVRDGSYNEQFTLNSINGTSGSNTVTFQSQSGDSSKVTLWYASGVGNNWVVQLNGADFIRFSKLTISRTGTNFNGVVVDMRGGAHQNKFLNNQLFGTRYNSTTTSNAIVYSNTDVDSSNTFSNNYFRNGSYGFYFFGVSSTIQERYNTFTNNKMDSIYYMGFQLYYQDMAKVNSNSIMNLTYTSGGYGVYMYYANNTEVQWNTMTNFVGNNAYGIFSNYCSNNLISGNNISNFIGTNAFGIYGNYSSYLKVLKNRIVLTNAAYGIYLYYCQSTAVNRGLVANNMVSVDAAVGNTIYGLYDYYSSYTDYYHNNFLMLNTNVNSHTFHYDYHYNCADNIVNNIAINTGGGLAIYLYNYNGTAKVVDNNDWYTSGSTLGWYNGTNYSTLATWRTASTKDSNSLNILPNYVSNSDLHVSHPSLNAAAKKLALVSDDYDGQTRNASTPDIGADEFTPPPVDAGVSGFINPNGTYCPGKQNVTVTITNYGANTLTSATINWTVNGTTQTAYSWTGSLNSGASTQATIGTYTFASASIYSVKAWTSSPNGTSDGNNANDSFYINGMKDGLTGTYTIGGTTPDYATVTLAVADLKLRGVCGPVVFNLRDGSYNEQVSIPQIAGTSSTNTITFQSQSGDSTKATIWYASGVGNNWVVQLSGADFIRFKKLTLSRTGTSNNGVVIDIRSGAHQNMVMNSRLFGPKYNSTTTANAIVYSNTDIDSSNTFTQNVIRNGAYAFYFFGLNSTTPERYNVFSNNTIDSIYYMAFQLYYQDRATVNSNAITNITYPSGGYGVYLYYSNNTEIGWNTMNNFVGSNTYGIYVNYSAPANIHHNQINMANGTGIYLYYSQATASNRGKIYNNMISVGGTVQVYGINDYFYCLNNDYSYNNILVTNTNSTSYGFYYYYHTTTADNVRNNIAYNQGGGQAVYFYNYGNTAIIIDNNDWATTGTILGQYNGTTYANLTAWVSGTKKDSNSLSVNPYYVSSTNLHVSNANLDGKARVLSGISDDYDGQTRNTSTPDIGADEFTPPANDAGITQITNPTVSYCAGKQNINVNLTNFSLNTLTSVKINWTVNGTTQTQYSWTGSLAGSASTNVTIGTYTFSSGTTYALKVWTSSPNGSADGNNSNDTSWSGTLKEGLSGTYTIGGTTPDYASFTLAVADLNSRGVCGPVVFNVRSGTYTEQIVINQFVGSSSTNTVTFQSQSLDSTAVTLTLPAGYYNNNLYCLKLNGADWVIFRKMTISRTTNNFYANVIELGNGACNNSFLNNRIMSNKYNYAGNYFCLVYSPSDNDTANTFRNNLMKYGSYGFYYFGVNTTSLERSTVIEDNIMDSIYYYGIQIYYQDGMRIRNNTITNQFYSTVFGVYCYYCTNGSVVDKNRIYIPGDGYGIYLNSCNSTSNARTIISNNMVSVGGSGSNYGIYSVSNNYTNTYYNSVWCYGASSGNAYYNSTNNNGYNNIADNSFVNTGGGYAVYIQNGGSTYINSIRNNNYYAAGTNLGYWQGTNYTSLANWKTGTGRDSNSISANPTHTSKTDLHAANPQLNNVGFANTVLDDNDGQIRSTSTPDIGADEFSPPGDDAGVASIDKPYGNFCGGTQNVVVTITNYGLNTLTSVDVNWTVNGTLQTKFSWTGSIASSASGSATIGSYNFSGSNYSLKIWTSKPNGATDGNNGNDTQSVNNLKQGMSGTYTIGGSSPDYTTFTLAAADLVARGVCGAVTFNARNGTYNEQFSIGSVFGTSATNTVTFQSQSNDSSNVTLSYASSGSPTNNYVVQLNGADWITFRQLTIARTGSGYYGIVFDLKSNANNNSFKSNRIIGSKSGSTASASAVINSTTDLDSNTTVWNNSIRFGSFGVYFNGINTTYLERSNNVVNNTFDSSYYMSIFLAYQDNGVTNNNTIANGIYTTGFYGIYGTYALNSWFNGNIISNASSTNGGSGIYLNQSKGFVVMKNKVNVASGYGIYLYFCQNDATKKGLCANNFATTSGTSSYTSHAYYWYYNTNTDYFYNSGSNTNSGTTFATLYYYGSGSTDHVMNNNMSNTGGGYAVYLLTGPGAAKSFNYNNYYFTGTNLGYNSGSVYTTIAAWKTGTNRDSSSISVNPQFVSSTDLHIKNPALKAGKGVNRVKEDIDGLGRPIVATMGACEYVPSTLIDMSVVTVYRPISGGCGTTTNTIAIIVVNNGATPQTNIPFAVKVSGSGNATVKDTLKKTLYYSDRDTFYFKNTFSTAGGGVFNLRGYSTIAGDQDHSNDTAYRTITIAITPAAPTVTDGMRCGAGQVMLKATNTLKATQYWYASAGSTTLLYKGDIYFTPNISSTTTYYVESWDSTGSCVSTRSAVTATINGYPSGAGVTKGSSFSGLFNLGSSSNPDQVCINGPAVYDITPPTGFTNSQYGTKWSITNIALITSKGTVSKDTATKKPGVTAGTITFSPSVGNKDSTFILYMTVKNLSTGCDSSFIRYIYVQPAPKPAFSASKGCVGNLTIFTNTTSGTNTYLWKFGDGGTSTLAAPTHTYASSGSFNVTLIAYNGAGCGDSTTIKITVYTSPSKPTVTNASRCGTGTVVLTAKNSSKLTQFWYASDTSSTLLYKGDNFTTPSISKTTIYYVESFDTASGVCPSARVPVTATINVIPGGAALSKGTTFDGLFNAGTSTSPDQVCSGGTAIYSLTPPTGFLNSEFGTKWVISNLVLKTAKGTVSKDTSVKFPGATNGTLTFTPTASSNDSTFILYVTVKNMTTGCDSSFTRYIYVQPRPKPSFTFGNGCVGNLTVFTNTTSGSNTYAWKFGDGGTSTATSPSHNYAGAGTYNVTLIVTNTTGCSDSVTQKVSVYASPTVTFGATTVCLGDSTMFMDTITTPSGTTITKTYYTFGDGGSATYSNPYHTYKSAGNFTVWLMVQNSNGCKDSTSRTVTVNAVPSAGFTTKDVCLGDSVKFTNTTSGATSYTWDFGDGSSTSSATNPSHLYTTTGAFTVKLTAKNAAGCSVSYSKVVNVYGVPVASFTAKDGCIGDSVRFTNTSTTAGAVTYSWNFGDGSPLGSAKDPAHLYTSAGSYLVKLTVTTPAGCSDFDTMTINVYVSPTSKWAAKNVCDGDSVHFTNFTTGSGTLTYAWDFGDGNTSTATNPVHLYAAAGTYTVKMTASYASGCSGTLSTQITVYPAAIADFTTADVCMGNTVLTTNKSTGGTLSYVWDFGDGTAKSTITSPIHNYKTSGKFTITLVATNSNGCTDTKTIDVNVNEKPVAKFGFAGNCVKTPTQFTDSSTISSGTLTYNWNFGDAGTSTVKNPVHTYQGVQNYQVTLIVTSSLGCSDTFVKTVSIVARPSAVFSKTITPGRLATFTPADQSLVSYTWDFGDGGTSTTTAPTHQYATNGKYAVKLTVKSANGCSQTYTDTANVTGSGIYDNYIPLFNLSIQPNPFTISTTLHYGLDKSSLINAAVYDMTGRLMATLVSGKMEKGEHTAIFDAQNIPSGLYMLRISVDGQRTTREIIRLK